MRKREVVIRKLFKACCWDIECVSSMLNRYRDELISLPSPPRSTLLVFPISGGTIVILAVIKPETWNHVGFFSPVNPH